MALLSASADVQSALWEGLWCGLRTICERNMRGFGEALPMSAKKTHILLVGVVIVAVALAVLDAMSLEVCRDYAFICENTGSHKGYRQWCFGRQRRQWRRTSCLEEFMQCQHPTELRYRWTSYAGTGKNAFGRSIRFGHGRPGVGSVIMNSTWFDWYVVNLDDAAKLDLYRVLASGDRDAIETEEGKIEEAMLERSGVE
jgi:hypothetical protein